VSGDDSKPHFHHGLGHPAELCAKSARLGHKDAITEIGYCLWSCARMPDLPNWVQSLCIEEGVEENEMELDEGLSNSGLDMQHERQPHPANLFLVEWWQLADVKNKNESDRLQICSRLCGRREMRNNEFYRCSCNNKFYCSHACQDVHWETEHHATCNNNMMDQ
jgi:MYND finger